MIRSGDRIRTETGTARRPLTLAEAEAGGLPEPFTRDEWRAAYAATAAYAGELLRDHLLALGVTDVR